VFRNMEKWVKIRRKVLANETSKRAICREYKIHWDTLQRILTYAEPPSGEPLSLRAELPQRSGSEAAWEAWPQGPTSGGGAGGLVCADRLVARHPRHWGKEHVEYNPLHYPALWERKPGGLDSAKPLEHWNLPECSEPCRRTRTRARCC